MSERENPYEAPSHDSPSSTDLESPPWEFPPGAFIVCGIFQMMLSAISLLVCGFQLAAAISVVRGPNASFFHVELLVFSGIAIIMQLAIFNGALAMMKRENFNAAWYGSILAAIPCFGICAFPAGVVGLILLMPQTSRTLFDDQDEEPATA